MCEAAALECRCILPPNHGGPHQCECGAKWTGKYGHLSFRLVWWAYHEGQWQYMAVPDSAGRVT